jgi:hypothetical protein
MLPVVYTAFVRYSGSKENEGFTADFIESAMITSYFPHRKVTYIFASQLMTRIESGNQPIFNDSGSN